MKVAAGNNLAFQTRVRATACVRVRRPRPAAWSVIRWAAIS